MIVVVLPVIKMCAYSDKEKKSDLEVQTTSD